MRTLLDKSLRSRSRNMVLAVPTAPVSGEIPLLEAQDLCYSYGKRPGLRGLSFAIGEPGRIVGIFGANGAGKTTLQRIVSTLINSYTGDVVAARESRVVYLPDYPILPRQLQIESCIELYASLYSDFDADRARDLIDRLGLPRDIKVAATSKGMSEQLHLVLTLSRKSDLYLFDEPLAGVDPLTRDTVISIIQEFKPAEATIFISTHLISGLETLFDEIVVIANGQTAAHIGRDEVDGDLEAYVKEVLREGL